MAATPRTNALAKQLREKEGCNLDYRSEKALLKLCRRLERELQEAQESPVIKREVIRFRPGMIRAIINRSPMMDVLSGHGA